MSNYQEAPTATDECPVCYEPYEDVMRIVTPSSCVHPICIDCYQHCDSCPNCRASYSNDDAHADAHSNHPHIRPHIRLPHRPPRAIRSDHLDAYYQRIMRRKRHISALIHMFRQFVTSMRRAETANGMEMHAQYLGIGHAMIRTIVRQEVMLQSQMTPTEVNPRRRCYYQSAQYNLLGFPDLNLHEVLMAHGLMASPAEMATIDAIVPLPELPVDQYPLSLRLTRSQSNTNHARELLDRLQEEFAIPPELPEVFIST